MSISTIYKQRFSDTQMRNTLWEILVKFFFQQFINEEDIVLDIACGYGEFINNISCKRKYAVDINPDAKRYIKKDATFIQCSSTNIKLPDKSVDKVFISNFFEHLHREDIVATVREVKRVLRKKGEVLILQPNIRFCSRDYWMFFDHITPIDDRALIELFGVEEFRLEKNVVKFLPFTTKSRFHKHKFFVKMYLHFPILWHILGKQSFLIFKKND